MNAEFTENLLRWNELENRRQMPWKGEKDPYRIWLSEIILQQTRVEQGLAYYERFVNTFPDVHALAGADDAVVFKLWEGLGYYSRCKNILVTARYISTNLGGQFPASYADLLLLKGIGPYTAAAISSFAFGEKRAVVDGNVQRVLARYFGISTPVDVQEGKKLFAEIADALIDPLQPARYNQAIMDFGATICKPRNPLCETCIQRADCQAYLHGFVHDVPVKEKSMSKRLRWMNYLVVRNNDCVFIRKRTGSDIWQNLHEFILLESPQELEAPSGIYLDELFQHQPYHISHVHRSPAQQLTHQKISGTFFVIDLSHIVDLPDYKLVNKRNLRSYAFPRFINSFLESHPI
jgi:A/G-specific adenine glycosylase